MSGPRTHSRVVTAYGGFVSKDKKYGILISRPTVRPIFQLSPSRSTAYDERAKERVRGSSPAARGSAGELTSSRRRSRSIPGPARPPATHVNDGSTPLCCITLYYTRRARLEHYRPTFRFNEDSRAPSTHNVAGRRRCTATRRRPPRRVRSGLFLPVEITSVFNDRR
ncbi:hypothetical protein EVAR_48470_1 [Eumeta japonica]|uniref:Uncharacterized protein n=1 Tax=Eumeta variegata TaxID=151549 RepID=A0A4C1XJ46_EUMVA|nr:hypothetical protein EVAR_48470_1 [Eumeta japonica]